MAGFWDFLPAIITAGATIYGTKQASAANNKAAETLTTAQKAGTAAQVAGLDTAKQVTQADQGAASPGLLAEQAIINRGTALTPQQEQAVADSRTTAINSLNGTGLRGSARATSATIADTDNRVRDNFMQQNQNNANTAAGALTGQYFNAGNNLATNATNTGQAVSQGLVNTGTITGSNEIGQGKLAGQAIGDVGATVANTVKNGIVQSNLTPPTASSYSHVGDSTTFNNGNTVNWNPA